MQITVPFTRTSFSTTAKLEVRSPSRLQVKFEEGIIRTPELLKDIEIPSTMTIMGQTIDTSNVASALKPLQSSVRDAVAQLGNLISQQPDLKIPIASERSQTWLLTTFLDQDTRILRGDRGSVYVLVKDVIIVEPVQVPIEESTKPETPLSIEYNEDA